MPECVKYEARPGAIVAAPFARTLIEAAADRGLDLERLALAVGSPVALLRQPPAGLSQEFYLRVLTAAVQLSGDAYFGLHAGQIVRPGSYSVLGHILMNCPNLGQALQQVLHYEALVHQLGVTRLAQDSGQVAVVWKNRYAQHACARDLAEFTFAGLLTCANWLAGRRLPVQRVDFMHCAPSDLRPLRGHFQAPLRFAQADNRLVLSAAVAAWPVRLADAGLLAVLREHADQLLARQRAVTDLPSQVGQLLVSTLARSGGQLEAVAKELGLTPRTLQRRLRLAGTSFSRLIDQLRQQRAREYLRNPRLSLVEVSCLLGYRNQSAFQRAFRDWTGETPAAWRSRCASQVRQPT